MALAIILARGGSERLPRKNLALLCGKPLVAHSIEAACQARTVTRVVVSTDDPDIAAVAESYGAGVIPRPAHLSTSTATSESALLHALDYLEDMEGYSPDLVVFLQPTSPYRLPEDIDGAVATFYATGADSVFSSVPELFTGRWRKNPDGTAYPINYDPHKRPRSQDYPIEYLGIGSIYVFRPSLLRETGCRTGGKIVMYEMPKLRQFQVDTQEDLDLLEVIMQGMKVSA